MHNIRHNQNGDGSIVAIISLAVVVVILGGVATWAIMSYNRERETVNQQIASAVEDARADQRAVLEDQFEEERNNPFRTYTAPSVFGGLSLDFPRTWNVYVEDGTRGRVQIDLTMHPEIVRDQQSEDDIYAFRMELQDRLFEQVNQSYQRDAERGNLDARAVTISGLEGVQYSGEVVRNKNGQLVVLPYRDKTIVMWTESNRFADDFEEILSRAQFSQ